MNPTRRQFVGHLAKGAAVIAVIGSAGALTSCNVVDDIANWIPIGVAALNSALTILSANGILLPPGVQLIVNATQAALNALSAAAKEYLAITPPPVGALAVLQAALKAVVDNFSTFLQGLVGITNSGLFNAIAAIVQLILSTIAGFMNQLPTSAGTKGVLMAASLKAGNVSVPIIPKARSRRAFKKEFNAQLAAGSGFTCPATAYFKLSFFDHL